MISAVIFDWGGTLSEYVDIEMQDMWRLAARHLAPDREDELTARPHPQSTIDDLSSTAKSSRTLGALFLGAGAAAAIGAGLLYFLPTGDGVAVQGRF